MFYVLPPIYVVMMGALAEFGPIQEIIAAYRQLYACPLSSLLYFTLLICDSVWINRINIAARGNSDLF